MPTPSLLLFLGVTPLTYVSTGGFAVGGHGRTSFSLIWVPQVPPSGSWTPALPPSGSWAPVTQPPGAWVPVPVGGL